MTEARRSPIEFSRVCVITDHPEGGARPRVLGWGGVSERVSSRRMRMGKSKSCHIHFTVNGLLFAVECNY